MSDGVDVSTPFPPWGYVLGFLLLRVDSPLAASSLPRLRSWLATVLGDSSGACLDILEWPRRHAVLRPRRQYTGTAPFGLGGALPSWLRWRHTGAAARTRLSDALRSRHWRFLVCFYFGVPFLIGLCFIVARATFAWTSWGWPPRHSTLRPRWRYTRVVPFGLGGVMSFGFSGGTPVSPHELGYPTPFVRASDVSLWCLSFSP